MIFCKSLPVLLMVLIGLPLWPQGRIVRPVDGASVASGKLSILATAPNGRIEFDGKPLAAEARFPDVFEATVQPSPGEHTIRLVWEGGFEEIRIWYGPNAPEGFLAFRSHPPAAVECTQCHAVSRRGRFRFSGGCFDCHRQEGFVATHQHPSHVFERCGTCHNAHGSTAKSHFVKEKKDVCGLCHTVPVAP